MAALELEVGTVARLEPDQTFVRIAALSDGQHVLVLLPGGRRQFVERRHLILPASSKQASEDARAFAREVDRMRARAISDARVIAAEAERQACERAAAHCSSCALSDAPRHASSSVEAGRRWVRGVFSNKGAPQASSPESRAASMASIQPDKLESSSALVMENAQLRLELSQVRAKLEEARRELSSRGPSDKWIDEQKSQERLFESLTARNKVLETALVAAEAQLRSRDDAVAADCARLRTELCISERRARGYQAVVAALEQQVERLREQLMSRSSQSCLQSMEMPHIDAGS
mmetsp:Transcript_30893/g.94639  ORF Transcript_30893/g.94639 Transcript_30893/m.94639 type:complete len:292 (+) Transcript_30893:197-1072(+)|eukprot:scaffold198538_cov37-Tisochrysis_lutea.AAC.1